MMAWIVFSPELRLWSAFTFWMVVVSIVLTLGFTITVFFGGMADLRFLLRALDEPRDDGPSTSGGSHGDDTPAKH